MTSTLRITTPLLFAVAVAAACGGSTDNASMNNGSPATGDDGGTGAGSGSGSGSGSGGGSGSSGGGSGSSSGSGGGSGSSSGGGSGSGSGGTTDGGGNGVPALGHVYLVVLENHSYATVKGATYISSLLSKYASASAYKDSGVHPSLPNYIALSSGDNQGVTCDCQASGGGSACGSSCNALSAISCTCLQPSTVSNVGSQLTAKGLPWHAYGEDMTGTCDRTNHGNYVARHVPFVYFQSISDADCQANVVGYTTAGFAADIGKYAFSFIAPNLCDDGHNTCAPQNDQVKQTDDWLAANVPAIESKLGANDALFITWDEGDESLGGLGPTDDNVLLVVVSPMAKPGFVTTAAYTHYSLLATIETGLGLPLLGKAQTAPLITDVWK
jgi:hypothetical protein